LGPNALRIALLGPFRLVTGAGLPVHISSKRSIAIIALLATAPDGVRSRNWLQAMLWGNRGPAQAQASLRRELSNLAALLERHGAGTLLRRDRQNVALDLARIDIDILARMGGAAGAGARQAEFLEGLDLRDCEAFEDWLREQRTHLARLDHLLAADAAPVRGAPSEVHGGPLPSPRELIGEAAVSRPPKPSLAILPFAARTAGPDDAALAAGIADEIELTLVSFRSMFIVAGMSAAAARDRGLTALEVARVLGVRYLLAGVLECHGEAVRVRVSIIDGEDEATLWSQSFTGSRTGVFDLQQQIARAVAPRIHTTIDASEMQRGLARSALDGDSYQLYWRANALFRRWDAASVAEATALCEQLVNQRPDCAWAAAMAGFCKATAFASDASVSAVHLRRSALSHCQKALASGGDDPTVLGYCAGTLVLVGGDITLADRLVTLALDILPGYQPTLFWAGWVDLAIGRLVEAREHFQLALRVNPDAATRPHSLAGIGLSLLLEGETAEAHAMLSEALHFIPTYPMALAGYAVASVALGEMRSAHRAAAALGTLGAARVGAMLREPAQRETFEAALRTALAGAGLTGSAT
jgi:TolB-like protein